MTKRNTWPTLPVGWADFDTPAPPVAGGGGGPTSLVDWATGLAGAGAGLFWGADLGPSSVNGLVFYNVNQDVCTLPHIADAPYQCAIMVPDSPDRTYSVNGQDGAEVHHGVTNFGGGFSPGAGQVVALISNGVDRWQVAYL